MEYTHEKKLSKLLKYCPINNTFEIIGKKFTILILRNMINDKPTRFNQFLNSIEGNNPKTLSIRLKEMEKMGLIERKVFPNETPIRIEYYPTEKRIALQQPIIDMMQHIRCNIVVKTFSKMVNQENAKYSTIEKFQGIEVTMT